MHPDPASAAAPSPLRILAADDHAPNRLILSVQLETLGYHPVLVASGSEVLERLETETYDLLILDYQMPDIDGTRIVREVVRRYPQRAQRPKLMFITASIAAERLGRETALALDGFLSKPARMAELQACIQGVFRPAGSGAATPLHPPDRRDRTDIIPLIGLTSLAGSLAGFTAEEQASCLRDLQEKVRSDFADSWPGLNQACRERNPAVLGAALHGLSGCFRLIGWSRLAGLCDTTLQAVRTGVFSSWDELPPRLLGLYDESYAAMAERLAKPSPPADCPLPAQSAPDSRRSICWPAETLP